MQGTSLPIFQDSQMGTVIGVAVVAHRNAWRAVLIDDDGTRNRSS